MHHCSWTLLAVLTAACCSPSGDPSPTGDTGPPPRPICGTWTTGSAEVASDPCGFDLQLVEIVVPSGFFLFEDLSGGYTLQDHEESAVAVPCRFAEGTLTCDQVAFDVGFGPTLLDVQQQVSADVTGAETLAVARTTRLDCPGGSGSVGCTLVKHQAEVEGLPCEVVQTYTATWASSDAGPLDPDGSCPDVP